MTWRGALPLSRSRPCAARKFLHFYLDHWPSVAARTRPKEGLATPLAFLRAASALRRDMLLFQPGYRLLKALCGVPFSGVIGRMMRPNARHLLLQGGKPLKFGLRHVGQMVGTFL